MTKRPLELADPVRNEDELVPMTFIRQGHVRSTHLPRWVAVRITEAEDRKWKAIAEAQRERLDRWRHWFAGMLYGLGLGVMAAGRFWRAGALFLASGLALGWPTLRDWWRRWRER